MTPDPFSGPLVLASASPRRHELLESVGIPHEVLPPHADVEPASGRLPPAEHARIAALAKAIAVAVQHPGALVLGADTVVAIGEEPGDVLGKPSDDEDALRMLRLLSGREHAVLTALALVRLGSRPVQASLVATTRVVFAALPEAFLKRYVESGEPRDKAGAYAVQGRIATHVQYLGGSWSNVVGLPLEELPALFRSVGEDLEDWRER